MFCFVLVSFHAIIIGKHYSFLIQLMKTFIEDSRNSGVVNVLTVII